MNERLLQFIWQHQYFNKASLQTEAKQAVQIIFQGTLNTNQGPDFSNARIKIDNIQLAGNVELHIRTSDWLAHGHTGDVHYKNVILHVVWEHDGQDGNDVLVLKSRVAVSLLEHYELLMLQKEQIPCRHLQSKVPDLVWSSWKERLFAERMQQKAQFVQQLLHQTKQHWEEVFWQLLARNFGTPINSSAFEAIAKTIPVSLLAKHKNQIHQLEALLLGQAGLLETDFEDAYAVMLQKEYRYLKKKYKLVPVHEPVKFLKMRPSNFPTVRLAQLAMLVHNSSHLFSKVIEAKSIKEIKNMLNVTANDFWNTHYTLHEPSGHKIKNLGALMVDNLLINTILPVLFVYAAAHRDVKVQQKIIEWLQDLPKENNRITRLWEDATVKHTNAFDSQALFFLKKNYCDVKLCLSCAVGNSILKK